MVLDDYVRRVRELDARRLERLADITSAAHARAYCDEVRLKARACLGPLLERTPLHTGHRAPTAPYMPLKSSP